MWKSVVNQVFEVGSGRKVEDIESEVDIFLRIMCGWLASVSEDQVALDLLLQMLQTLEEIRRGEHQEDIEKVMARIKKCDVGTNEEKKYRVMRRELCWTLAILKRRGLFRF